MYSRTMSDDISSAPSAMRGRAVSSRRSTTRSESTKNAASAMQPMSAASSEKPVRRLFAIGRSDWKKIATGPTLSTP